MEDKLRNLIEALLLEPNELLLYNLYQIVDNLNELGTDYKIKIELN